jgi:tyrosine-protein kinase Etk/Wzc
MNPAQFKNTEAIETPNIKRLVLKYLYHWPLFVITIPIAIAAGMYYLKVTKPVYQVKASLIIDTDKGNNQKKASLEEIDFINANKTIENEIEIIKSNKLIKKTVNDLQLWVSYKKLSKLTDQDLYSSKPVRFQALLPIKDYRNISFNIVVINNDSFYLKTASGKLNKHNFGDALKSKFGTWKLLATPQVANYKDAEIKISVADPEKIATSYQKAIDASLPNKLTSTIVLTLDDGNADRGMNILNNLLSNYNLRGKTEKNTETEKMLKFLDKRIDTLDGGLTTAEQGIEGFKSSRGLTDITSDAKMSLDKMQDNDNQLNNINIQLSTIEGIERYLASPGNEKFPATVGIADPSLTNSLNKLSDLQLQRERLLATAPETNPDFDPINRQIVSTKAAIRENVRNIKSSFLSTKRELMALNSSISSTIRAIPTQERQYGSIKRQQSIKENLYTYLLQKREELSVKYASELANDHIVDAAYIGGVKAPKKLFVLGIALLVGIALPILLMMTRNFLSENINDIAVVKKALGIPVIAQLQYEKFEGELIANDQGATSLSEQFRSLRIHLNHYLRNNSGKVTLVTSSIFGEGKSFISRNLSVALAYTGKKTVIVELDLRKPAVAKQFNLDSQHTGVTDFLNNKATLADIVQPTALLDSLFFISSGTTVLNPSELLEGENLEKLFNALRSDFDCIVIDSPPVHLVPDAMVLSKVSDITLYVIRQGYTKSSELDFIKDLLQQDQLTNAHIVFNGIEHIKHGYGYSYSNSYYNSISTKKSIMSPVFSDFAKRF